MKGNNILICLEGFQKENKKSIYSSLEKIFKSNIIYIEHDFNEYNNLIKTSKSIEKLNDKTELLMNIAELNEFYINKVKHELLNNVVLTENYFDGLLVKLDNINLSNNNAKLLDICQERKADLSILLNNNKTAVDMSYKYPERCKLVNTFNKKGILEHIYFLLQRKATN